jgi:signal transduction histidine kinase
VALIAPVTLSAQSVPQGALQLQSLDYLAGYTAPDPPPAATPGSPVSLPIGAQGLPGQQEAPHWLRSHFARAGWPPGNIGIYVLHASPGAAIYLNGSFIGATGGFGDPQTDTWNYPMFLILPAAALHTEDNELLIELAPQNSGNRRLDAVLIGPESELFPLYQRALWVRVLGVEIVCASVGLVGLFAVVLWIRQRGDAVFGLFALTCLLWILLNTRFFVANAWMPRVLFDSLTDIALFWMAAALFTLCFRILDSPLRRIEIALFCYALLMTVLTLTAVPYALVIVRTGSGILLGFASLFLLFLTWRVSQFGSVLGWLLWLAALGSCYSAGHDYLQQLQIIPGGSAYLMPYSALSYAITIGWLLIDRFVRTQKAYERLNQELESRLQLREAELGAQYSQMALLERDQTIAAERERILRDMHDGLGLQLISSLRLVEKGNLSRDQTKELLEEAIDEMRIAIDSAKPTGSDLLVMLGNLRYRLEPRLASAGIVLEWAIGDNANPDFLTSAQVTELTRIVQEAFANAIKHSGASRMRLSVDCPATHRLSLVIEDNGHGFDVQAASRGEGLQSIRKRAARIGAELLMESSAGRTAITIGLAVPA